MSDNLFPSIGPTERKRYIAIGRIRTATRLTRQHMTNQKDGGDDKGIDGKSVEEMSPIHLLNWRYVNDRVFREWVVRKELQAVNKYIFDHEKTKKH